MGVEGFMGLENQAPKGYAVARLPQYPPWDTVLGV